MNKKLIISLVMICVMAFGAGLGTYAWFTSSDVTSQNTIQAGTLTVDLKTNMKDAVEKPFYISGNLLPGDYVTMDEDGQPGFANIEIVNTGNTDLFYFDNFVLSGYPKLAEAIIIKTWKNTLVSIDGTHTAMPYDAFIENGIFKYVDVDYNDDGKVSLAEWLDDRNTQMGPKNGWDFGVLKPGYKFIQEFEFTFAEGAGNEYKGLALNGAFKVLATQYKADAIDDLINKQSIPYTSGAAAFLGAGQTVANRYAAMH